MDGREGRKEHLGKEHFGKETLWKEHLGNLFIPLRKYRQQSKREVMKSAALWPLFSSNRKHVRKSVKLFLNLLENSRGTFPWNI